MDQLIRDSLEFLKQEAAKQDSILVSPEEFEYFSTKKKRPSEVIDPEMQKLIKKALPEMALKTEIPPDHEARKRSNLWKEPQLTAQVLVLTLKESDAALQLLQNMTKAIHSHLAPAHLIEIEKENGWEMILSSPQLKLILAPPLQEWKSLSLARFYKETPASKTCFLGETPVILMQQAAAYLKNPELKKDLWKTLSTLLSTST